MFNKCDKNVIRKDRHKRIRGKISGTAEMPRLSVYRSNVHIYAQLIDDTAGKTLVSASTTEKALSEKIVGKTKCEQAQSVGELLGKKAIKKGIKTIVFDRSGYLYTGRVQKVAEGARSAGLQF